MGKRKYTDAEAMQHKNMLIAASRGHMERVKAYIDAGCDVSYKNCCNETALLLAAGSGNLELVKFLVGLGGGLGAASSVKISVVHQAAANGDVQMLDYFITEKKLGLHPVAFDGNTPLHAAVRMGNPLSVSWLISHKASVNRSDNDCQTPLWVAAGSRHGRKVAKLLIKGGADVNALNIRNESPLHAATRRADLAVCKLLVKYGAKLYCEECEVAKRSPCDGMPVAAVTAVREMIATRKANNPGLMKRLLGRSGSPSKDP